MSIKAVNLSYNYMQGTPFENNALNCVEADIKEGEFVLLAGSTGSGKSTLVQHFNGLIKPASGSVYIFGKDIWEKNYNLKKLRQDVGLVFQFPESQLFEKNIYDDIAFGPRCAEVTEEEIDRRMNEYLSWIGLTKEEAKKRSPFTLSGGQMRKVALAGVMIMNPRVLILDEPTVSLDPKSTQQVMDKIKTLHKTRNSTIIVVTHNLNEVIDYTQQVIIMDKGKIIFSGRKEKLADKKYDIESIGLELPEQTKLLIKLKEKGIDIRTDIFGVDETIKEIKKIWSF